MGVTKGSGSYEVRATVSPLVCIFGERSSDR